MNSWFGSGARTKSVGRRAGPIAFRISSGSSSTVRPPVSLVASSSAGISFSHSLSGVANITVTSSGRMRRERSQSRAAGSASVSVSNWWSRTTSTPRSRMRSVNASNSCLARRTQITSSKSSSWQFVGDSRSCARSGRCTITVRSFPTSECVPSAVSVAVLISSSPVSSSEASVRPDGFRLPSESIRRSLGGDCRGPAFHMGDSDPAHATQQTQSRR